MELKYHMPALPRSTITPVDKSTLLVYTNSLNWYHGTFLAEWRITPSTIILVMPLLQLRIFAPEET